MLICWATIRVISMQIKLVIKLITTINRVNNQAGNLASSHMCGA